MTREQEIDNEAKRNFFLTKEEEIAFLIGAEWADRTMIDKACEWLSKANYTETFVKKFRKAMEE